MIVEGMALTANNLTFGIIDLNSNEEDDDEVSNIDTVFDIEQLFQTLLQSVANVDMNISSANGLLI